MPAKKDKDAAIEFEEEFKEDAGIPEPEDFGKIPEIDLEHIPAEVQGKPSAEQLAKFQLARRAKLPRSKTKPIAVVVTSNMAGYPIEGAVGGKKFSCIDGEVTDLLPSQIEALENAVIETSEYVEGVNPQSGLPEVYVRPLIIRRYSVHEARDGAKEWWRRKPAVEKSNIFRPAK